MTNNALRPEKQEFKEKNLQKLKKAGFEFTEIGANHFRFSDKFDFWPTTGRFCELKDGTTGDGVNELIKRLKSMKVEADESGYKVVATPVKRPINPNAPAHTMNIRTRLATDFMSALLAKYGGAPEVCDISIALADRFIEQLNKTQEPKKNEQQ